MNIYLAARYSSKERMQVVAIQLIQRGFHITSNWIFASDRPEDPDQIDEGFRRDRAILDFEEVSKSHILILDLLDGPGTRGAQWAELGIALGLNLQVLVIGPTENVFAYHPKVRRFYDWSECTRELDSFKKLMGV